MKSKIVAIIQARMGSTRLPGKVLKEVQGVPLLGIMMSRVERSEMLNEIVIATSSLPMDDQIEEFCQENGYECFRGSENDVLSRYFHCATKYHVDIIVRLTADCPLIDPIVIDDVVKIYVENDYDYVANTAPPEGLTYPEGMDVEIFSFQLLERAAREAQKPSEREHVTHYFWKNSKSFSTYRLDLDNDFSVYRLTVDYPEDLEVIKEIVHVLYQREPLFSMYDMIKFLDANPSIKEKNSCFRLNAGWQSSYNKDKQAGL
jgi:spore coat polysaccharide biosynthesis protein SpsF|tara:strand:- start:460 stop:1239 length:780 start_codon:yes stop_codon:yes gene_type:complete